ncbi:retrovirus-related pol polyprotein from transposon TNT 1-94 [Tanacetum coccineum]
MRVTRELKKYAKLFVAEKIQADCDMKATNIILQVLPADIYSLVIITELLKIYEREFNFEASSSYSRYSLQVNVLLLISNKAMDFLSAVASSRFPSTNNQLRTSSNPRNQAIIQDGRVIVQQVQRRQGQSYSGTGIRVMLLALGETTHRGQHRTEDLDTYDSDCHDISNAQEVLMANISNYGFDVISEATKEHMDDIHKQALGYLNINLSSHEKMIDSQMDDMIMEKIALKEQVDSLEQNVSKQIKEKECLLQTFTVFKKTCGYACDDFTRRTIDLEDKESINKCLIKAKVPRPLDHFHIFAPIIALRISIVDLVVSDVSGWLLEGMGASGSNATDIPSSSSLVMTGTVRFGNDHIARIMGYGDYQLGNVTISRVYNVEGLGHNFFSVGQFCDADLEVEFQKNTCFIRNLEGVDLLSGPRDINLYTISLDDMLKTSPICLISKASKTKSWLWHRWLSYLNFGTLNKLAKDGLARGIPRLKFHKDHLCSACALGKSKKSSHQPKAKDTNQEKLYLLHINLCGPMQVAALRGMVLAESPVSTSIDQDAPSSSTPSTQEQEKSPNISQGFKESPKTPIFHDDPLYESPHEELSNRLLLGSSSTHDVWFLCGGLVVGCGVGVWFAVGWRCGGVGKGIGYWVVWVVGGGLGWGVWGWCVGLGWVVVWWVLLWGCGCGGILGWGCCVGWVGDGWWVHELMDGLVVDSLVGLVGGCWGGGSGLVVWSGCWVLFRSGTECGSISVWGGVVDGWWVWMWYGGFERVAVWWGKVESCVRWEGDGGLAGWCLVGLVGFVRCDGGGFLVCSGVGKVGEFIEMYDVWMLECCGGASMLDVW